MSLLELDDLLDDLEKAVENEKDRGKVNSMLHFLSNELYLLLYYTPIIH